MNGIIEDAAERFLTGFPNPDDTINDYIGKNNSSLIREAEDKLNEAYSSLKGNNYGIHSLLKKFVEIRQSMKTSYRVASFCVIIGSIGVIWNGCLSIIRFLFHLNILSIIIKIYQIIFGIMVLLTEISRYISLSGTRAFIHTWIPCLEYTLGRGFIQLLASGLAVGEGLFTSGALFSLMLGIIGLLNILCGYGYCVMFAQISRQILKQLENESEDKLQQFEALQRKFRSLDRNGDNRITRTELIEGVQSFNIPLSATDIDVMFRLFDPNKLGYINIDSVETWWISQFRLGDSV